MAGAKSKRARVKTGVSLPGVLRSHVRFTAMLRANYTIEDRGTFSFTSDISVAGMFLFPTTLWSGSIRLGQVPNLHLLMSALVFAVVSSVSLCLGPWLTRRKRCKLGLCVACGYDLRGSAGRCPECGKEFS